MICACERALRSITARPLADLRGEPWPLRSTRVHPSTAFSGVRSSWLSVARNSSLMRPARSASPRARRSDSSSCSRSCRKSRNWYWRCRARRLERTSDSSVDMRTGRSMTLTFPSRGMTCIEGAGFPPRLGQHDDRQLRPHRLLRERRHQLWCVGEHRLLREDDAVRARIQCRAQRGDAGEHDAVDADGLEQLRDGHAVGRGQRQHQDAGEPASAVRPGWGSHAPLGRLPVRNAAILAHVGRHAGQNAVELASAARPSGGRCRPCPVRGWSAHAGRCASSRRRWRGGRCRRPRRTAAG